MTDVRLFKAVKAFLMKESYDFTRSDINLDNFHPQCRAFIIPMGIFFNNRGSFLRFFWPAFCVSLIVTGNVLEIMMVLHGLDIKDYSFASECFYYFILLGVMVVVYAGMLFNRGSVIKILEGMDRDFKDVCQLDAKYKDPFMKGQLLIWQMCFIWLLFTIIVECSYLCMSLIPLIYMSLFATQDEHMIRPLIFPMWLPKDDPYRTPNYEIFFVMHASFLFIFIQTFAVYVYVQFHMLLHNYYMLKLVIQHIGVIFEGLDESVAYLLPSDERRIAAQRILNKRMEKIVSWHNSVFKSVGMISKVQGGPLVYQVMFSSVAICLMLYQVAEKLDNGTFDIRFGLMLVASLIQVWVPCYLSTLLMNKAFEVGDACWHCGWHETALGRLLRMDIIIIILRSQHPLSIKITGLPNLSLETYSSIVSSAYSYFNMLRKYKEL